MQPNADHRDKPKQFNPLNHYFYSFLEMFCLHVTLVQHFPPDITFYFFSRIDQKNQIETQTNENRLDRFL